MFRFRIARIVFQLIRLLLLVSIHIKGKENIPAKGPYLVTVNHNSSADTPLLLLCFPLVPWRFFAGEKWQAHRFLGALMGYLGAIFIRRGEFDRQALRTALSAVGQGAVFGLAPEGTRSRDGQMQPGKGGAAYLATRTGTPIVPVGLTRTDELFANVKRLRRTRVEVRIGEPYHLPDLGKRVKTKDLDDLTHLIMVKIAAQLPPRYRGYYAQSQALEAQLRGMDPKPSSIMRSSWPASVVRNSWQFSVVPCG